MGWDITLHHGADTGYGPDVVWIDNFVISGSDIYNAQGFDQFTEGLVNGQDGWRAGTERRDPRCPSPRPPCLLGLGLAGLARAGRRR